MAFKVGALSFGGGFVIIPLMLADAVGRGWMTGTQFLNAVTLGQITPGPVVQTVSAVGYAAAGLGGGLLAALVAFSPSFVFVLAGAGYFSVLRTSRVAQAFLDGAGPAAIGAILGSAVLLAGTLREPWQFAVLAGAAVLLLGPRPCRSCGAGWCSPCSPRPRPGCSSRWRAGRCHIDQGEAGCSWSGGVAGTHDRFRN